MSKICPKCRRNQNDERLIACPKCKVPYIDEDELVANFTREELQVIATFILKDWRVYVVAGLCLTIGVVVLYWQLHEQINKQIQKFQSVASNDVVVAYSTATNQLSNQFQDFTTAANNQLASAYSSVTNQIADEFQTPRIKQTVEEVAEAQAKEILAENVKPEVERFQADADLLRLAARARAYDFIAYQKLLKFENQTNDNAYLAKQVLAEIDRSLDKDRYYNELLSRHLYYQIGGTNNYSGPFSPEEIAVEFSREEQDSYPLNREGFINTASDMNQPLFLSEFIEFLTNEPDLSVADRITVAISKLIKQDFHPHDIERIKEWWRVNQQNFTNWPILEYQLGEDSFRRVQYEKAGKCFEQVLQIDPTADASRALAIACDLEIGDTNKAFALNEGFKNHDIRWAKFATAKIELETGNVSNATVEIAFIKTNFPTFSHPPTQGDHVWRKIDWNLFNTLTKADRP